jgi:hypothetical protein
MFPRIMVSVIVFQVYLLVLDRAPEPFRKDIIERPAAAIHADADEVILQNAGELVTRELRPLVAVEYLRRVAVFRAVCSISTQKSASSVIDKAHDTTYRLNQSMIAARYTKPRRSRM